jgi:uncharacterized protein (UPF0335 family)
MDIIKKEKETRELAYAQFKGLMKGAEIAGYDKNMIALLEIIFGTAKNAGDRINQIEEIIALMIKRIETLEQETKALKNSMDALDQNR